LLPAVPTPAFADPTTVLVFPLENQTDDRNLDWLGEGVAELIIDRLYSLNAVYVFDRDERIAGYERSGIPESAAISRATSVTLGWDMGADAIITGRLTGTHEDFHIEVRDIDLGSMR